MAIDHVIPYSAWGNNDLWNLMPSEKLINTKKSDKIPSQDTIKNSSDLIIEYWRLYHNRFGQRFEYQTHRALGVSWSSPNWERQALNGLIELTAYFSNLRKIKSWDPSMLGR
jgi:hypothetical protein